MDKEIFVKFQGKICKIHLKNGFVITGIIDSCFDTSFLFTTEQKTSGFCYDVIADITPVDNEKKV